MKLQEIISILNPEKIIYSSNTELEVSEPVQFSADNLRNDVIFWCNDAFIPKVKELQAGVLICSSNALKTDINKKKSSDRTVVHPIYPTDLLDNIVRR